MRGEHIFFLNYTLSNIKKIRMNYISQYLTHTREHYVSFFTILIFLSLIYI